MSCSCWKSCSISLRFQTPSKYHTSITACVRDSTNVSEISFNSVASKMKYANVIRMEIKRQHTTQILWLVVIATFTQDHDENCQFKIPKSFQCNFDSFNTFILNCKLLSVFQILFWTITNVSLNWIPLERVHQIYKHWFAKDFQQIMMSISLRRSYTTFTIQKLSIKRFDFDNDMRQVTRDKTRKTHRNTKKWHGHVKCRHTRVNNQYLIPWWNGSNCSKIASSSLCITKFLLSVSWILWNECYFARICRIWNKQNRFSQLFSLSIGKQNMIAFQILFQNFWCVSRQAPFVKIQGN